MAFAVQLQDSLRRRERRVAGEFAAGDSLEAVLGRHLLAVEASAETELITSILLLDETGRRLWHGAAPNLPRQYCEAIDGSEIGPAAGSCGTAAYTGRAVYVTDVATDPLWEDYRDLALPHGLRACWSTPIHDPAGAVIGTFAVYHPTPRSPTPDEVSAIRLITDHVAQAILWSRDAGDGQPRADSRVEQAGKGKLKLVDGADGSENGDEPGRRTADRLQFYATRLDRYAERVESPRVARALRALAADCRRMVESLAAGRKRD
ncbi:MAG TPA: GAF domain-containing protein [Sphingomicrobium sp.]|nr:GAF domain-containing protein [Sphingomicrobium sp.]